MDIFYLYSVIALFSCGFGAYLSRLRFVSPGILSLASIAILIPSTSFLAHGSFLIDMVMHILFVILFQFGLFAEVVVESLTFWVDED